jgi:hypothetical protein
MLLRLLVLVLIATSTPSPAATSAAAGFTESEPGTSGAKAVVPRDLAKPVMHLRMASADPIRQMPPLARNLADGAAVSAVTQSIAALPGGGGLKGQYWTNQDTFIGAPTLVRTDPMVDFDWGVASPDPGVTADRFTARWTGSVQAAYSETYTFAVTSDDGVRLWVDNQLLIDRWVDQEPSEWTGTIALNAGQKYDLRLEYYEDTGGAQIQLRWSSPSTPKELVPQNRLFPGAAVPVLTTIAITPADATVARGSTLRYVAMALDQDGAELVPQPAFSWVLTGGGSISGVGLFTASVGGSATVTAQATSGSITRSGSTQVTVTEPIAVKIDFQPAAAPPVPGYLLDSGLAFAARGNGYTYGWNVDISDSARDRNLLADQLRDTLLQMQQPVAPDASWEIAVPNGSYQVLLVSGDPMHFDSVIRVDIEGVLGVSGETTGATTHFTSGNAFQVQVSDGRLTVSNGAGAVNNKVCSIEIIQVPTAAN